MYRLLLVDDEPTFVQETESWLNRHGWCVTVAHDGSSALSLLRAIPTRGEMPDAVLLDRLMPGMSGDEVLRQIHHDPKLARICVVMVTAFGNVPTAVECLRQGAFTYVEKPVPPLADSQKSLKPALSDKECSRSAAKSRCLQTYPQGFGAVPVKIQCREQASQYCS